MGTSTDAILFYGINYDDDEEWNPQGVDDYDVSEEWERSHEPKRPTDSDYKSAEWDAWRKANAEWEATGDGVKIGNHCSGDYPIHYVALTAHHIRNHRGDATEITPERLQAVTEIQQKALREFVELHGLKWKEPKWWLVSYWG